MQSSIFKNIVSAMLVALFAFAPILQVKEALAQSQGSYSYSSGGNASGGLKGYVKGLAPAIAQLPLCQKALTGPVKNMFKGIINKLGKKTVEKIFRRKLEEKLAAQQQIKVVNQVDNKKQDKLLSNAKSHNETDREANDNDTCYKSIGRMVVKMILQKITLSTVEWIKNGFNGGPAFVQNPGRFFKNIAKEEVLKFGIELNAGANCQAVFSGDITGTSGENDISKCISPFAKAYMIGLAETYNKKFSDNARYSLNELIANTTPEYTAASFSADFSAGGWNAWTAMTETPANNPVGFTVISDIEIGRRTDGTSKSTAEQKKEALEQSRGFLGDYRCADPEGLTQEQDREEQAKPEPDPARLCKRWEYVTPGETVAEAATKLVNYQDNNLLKAEDLNDAVAAIVDALISRLMGDVINYGLAEFSDEGADGDLIINSYAINGNYEIGQAEKDFPQHLQSEGWLTEHPNFNIRTDLTQAIIDEQRTYVEKLEKQNESLERSILGAKQADYCLPGPSYDVYTSISDTDLFTSFNDFSSGFLKGRQELTEFALQFNQWTAFQVANANGLFVNKERIAKKLIATYLGVNFGVHVYGAYGYSNEEDTNSRNQDQVLNKEDILGLQRNIFTSYQVLMHNIYFNGAKSIAPMPLVTKEIRSELSNVGAYQDIINENDEIIALKRSVIQRLAVIKNLIEDLGPVPEPNDSNFIEYEEAIKPIIQDFGRLTNDMVTGDDVAQIDTTLKETEDKEKYIFEDLLEACEREMLDVYENDKETYSRFWRRQPYKEPILYLYGDNVGVDYISVTNLNVPKIPQQPDHNSYDPHYHTQWSEQAIKNWNRNDMFAYGSFYWNYWVRPHEGGDAFNPNDPKTPNPPDLVKIKSNLQTTCPEFIDVVYFSYPGTNEGPTGEEKGQLPKDIEGLEADGRGYSINYGDNICGVLHTIEDRANIY